MERGMVLMVAVLLGTLAVLFPPTHSTETDVLMAALFVLALVCSLVRIYLSHSRMTVATAMPRSSASERW
jgi:protein-S-isoprenylcysteine O-methyltransferase Ste14